MQVAIEDQLGLAATDEGADLSPIPHRFRVLQTAQKRPEIAGSKWRALQNRVRNINGLAQIPIACRYIISHRVNHCKGARDQQHKDKKREIVTLGR
jgi:hypothetical protein